MLRLPGRSVSLSVFCLVASTLGAPTRLDDLTPDLAPRGYAINPDDSTSNIAWPDHKIGWCITDESAYDDYILVHNAAYLLWLNKVNDVTVMPEWEYSGACSVGTVENVFVNDMVFVSVNSNKQGASTVGYNDKSKARGRHTLTIDLSKDWGMYDAAANLAHEWGHIMGLFHEHQKPSAWKSDNKLLKFNCDNLKDYSTFKDKGEDMVDLCNNLYLAGKAGFSASNFIPYGESTTRQESSDFDWDSIMLYPSNAGGKTVNGVLKSTLVKADNSNIPPNTKPSKGDAAMIKRLYSYS